MKHVQIDMQAAAARMAAARRIVITTHVRADGDALGSAAGLKRILREQGKDVQAYVHEPLLARYAFMLDLEPVEIWDTASVAQTLSHADLCVIVDTCARSQLGDVIDAIEKSSVRKLAIDHHLSRDASVDELHVDENAAACAAIIARLAREAKWKIDEATAVCLYIGLASDTGWFRFSNSDASAYETAADLVRAGANPAELYQKLYLTDSPARLRLIGEVLSSLELLAEDRLAVIRVTREMLRRCGASQQMTEDIINEPMRIGSVVATVMLVESNEPGLIRASLRSKRDVDVAKVCEAFNGGGHARAAGAKIHGTMNEAAQRIIAAVTKALGHAQ